MNPDAMQSGGESRWFLRERWGLAALSADEIRGVGFAALMMLILFGIFHFYGNDVPNVPSRSAFVWTWVRWGDTVSYGGADYSHGWLIPFGSLWAVWFKRRKILSEPRTVFPAGLWIIGAGLLLHWVGMRIQQTRLSLAALILLLWALPLYFYGWRVARHLVFAAAYLIFCIPLTFLDVISFPLRMFVVRIAVALLNAVGIAAQSVGTAVFGGQMETAWNLDVAAPCSGLRSLLALMAIAALYAYATQPTQLKKWIIFLASIPLAVAGNIVRILGLGIIAEVSGKGLATGVLHDYSTYIVFSVAILLMFELDARINRDRRGFWHLWHTRREQQIQETNT